MGTVAAITGLAATGVSPAAAHVARVVPAVACSGGLSTPPRHDFNNDGYSDAVIGSQFLNVGGAAGAGAVVIRPGGPNGPTTTSDLYIREGSGPGTVGGTPTANDNFGTAIAWGDFNGDGCDDLAIGAPGKTLSGRTRAGFVTVVYGSASGLDTIHRQTFDEATTGVGTGYQAYAKFGRAVTGGDFNGDGFEDLAVGAPGDSFGGLNEPGRVYVLMGSSGGLVPSNIRFTQDSPGIAGSAESGDHFGQRLTAGDFNHAYRSGRFIDDLAVASPNEDLGTVIHGGAVSVLYGTGTGLTGEGSQLLYEGVAGIPGPAHSEDLFGWELDAGNFNADGYEDLAISATGAYDAGVAGAGLVYVVAGSSAKLDIAHSHRIGQSLAGVPGSAEPLDGFGGAMATGDFDGDGYSDLAVGTTFEDVGSAVDAGAATIIYGSAAGVTGARAQLILQGSNGVASKPEATDYFGGTLVPGNFDRARGTDLEIAAFGESVGAASASTGCGQQLCQVGAVSILMSAGASGLTGAGSEFVTRQTLPAAGPWVSDDHFGQTATP